MGTDPVAGLSRTHRPTSARAGARAAVALLAVGIALGTTGGCARAAGDEERLVSLANAPKSGSGEVRHDLEPLTSRIPALDGIVEATWFGGTFGDGDRNPGPSTYWIDAVVTLPPGRADQLRTEMDLPAANRGPQYVADLAPYVPDGAFLTSPELDETFSAGAWDTYAYLTETGDELVLIIVGE